MKYLIVEILEKIVNDTQIHEQLTFKEVAKITAMLSNREPDLKRGLDILDDLYGISTELDVMIKELHYRVESLYPVSEELLEPQETDQHSDFESYVIIINRS